MRLIKPTPEQLIRARERAEIVATRGPELRDLYWRCLGYPEDQRQLEELWPEMEGQWRAPGLDRPRMIEEVAAIEPITNRIKKPADPKAARKEALDRITRKMQRPAEE